MDRWYSFLVSLRCRLQFGSEQNLFLDIKDDLMFSSIEQMISTGNQEWMVGM